MKKILIISMFTLLFSQLAKAQNVTNTYKTAIGVKFYPTAISVKHFIADNKAVEGLGYFYRDGFRVTGLYELHYDINSVEGLKWYVGPGAHIGFWNDNWKKENPSRNSSIAIGVDGVLGLDYKIKDVPVNISFDWQPSLNIVGYTYFEAGWGGLAIRYTF